MDLSFNKDEEYLDYQNIVVDDFLSIFNSSFDSDKSDDTHTQHKKTTTTLDKQTKSDSSLTHSPSLMRSHKRKRSHCKFKSQYDRYDSPPRCLPYKDKSELTTAQLNHAKYQLTTFNTNFAELRSDFTVLEEYEKKFFKDTTLDVMFIMDITGSMGMWLGEAKNNITTIIEEITDSNPCANIRISFVGYRDYVEVSKPEGQYVSIDFTGNIHEVEEFISNIDAYGGGDEPEDIAGAFKLALDMNWQSKARYAVLVCDAPCHGSQYHNVVYDKYKMGDPNGLVIEDLVKEFVMKGITLYCVEINDSTNIMFEYMRKIYEDNKGEFHVETLGDACSKLPFFVAFGASVTLSNITYNKVMLEEVVLKFREDTINMIVNKYHNIIKGDNNDGNNNSDGNKVNDLSEQLISQIENLELNEKEQKMFEFINRMSSLNINTDNNNNSGVSGNNNNNDNDITQQVTLKHMNEWLNTNTDVLLPAKFHYLKLSIDQSGYNLINWSDLPTSSHHIDTQIKFTYYHSMSDSPTTTILTTDTSSSSSSSIPITVYDTFFSKSFPSHLPPKHPQYTTTLTPYHHLQSHFFTYTLCTFLCNQFNMRLKYITPLSQTYLKCIIPFLYEIPSFPLKYLQLNLIPKEFSRANHKLTSKLLDAFSHFTYQYTEGNFIIMNITLLNDSKVIESFTLWKKSEHDYGKLMKFFVYHVCNDICKKMNLVHPRKKKREIVINDEFYLFNYQSKIKLCTLCSLPIVSKDSLCNECNSIEKRGYRKKEVCVECREMFTYSPYMYVMKLIPFPKKCNKCTLMLI